MTRKYNQRKQLEKKQIKMRKKKRNTKLFILGVSLVFSLSVVALGLLSITQATLKDSDNKANNFSYGDLKADLVEEFVPNQDIQVGNVYEKKVSVKNNGEVDTFIRVLVLPEILSKVAEGETPLLLPSVIGQEINLLDGSGEGITNSSDWQNGQDGYYYYLKKLKPGETTATLFESATVAENLITKDNLYEEAMFDIHVKVEGIHTTQFAYRDGWWQGEIPDEPNLTVVDEVLNKLSI